MDSFLISARPQNNFQIIPPLIDPERTGGAHDLDLDDELLVQQSAFKGASNVYESEVAYVLEMLAPGFAKNDIIIDLDRPGLMTIYAQSSIEGDGDCFFARREFITESFTRSFRLPEDILLKEISASYENGIITVIIPKKAAYREMLTIILE